jgi:Uma2 family endonuclease
MPLVKAVDPRVSFAELQQWRDDGRRYELYDGEVIVVPAPIPRHQRVGSNVESLLREYERRTGGLMFHAPFDVVLTEYDVVQPDVVFFRAERRHLIDMMEATRVPPDLAVEVLSRSTERRDRGRKKDLLAKSGVPEYWIVDPIENVLEIHHCWAARMSFSPCAAKTIGLIHPRYLACRSMRARWSKSKSCVRIGYLLQDYAGASGGLALISPIDIAFTEHDVLQPDVVLFRPERRSQIDMMEVIRIAPDLAVEILSRSTEARDRGRKMQMFARFGVPEYWIVDSPTLTGLSFEVHRVFEVALSN